MVHLFLSLRYDQVSDTHTVNTTLHSTPRCKYSSPDRWAFRSENKMLLSGNVHHSLSNSESRELSACLKKSMPCAHKRSIIPSSDCQRHDANKLSVDVGPNHCSWFFPPGQCSFKCCQLTLQNVI